MVQCRNKYHHSLLLIIFLLLPAATSVAGLGTTASSRDQTTPAHVYAQLQRVELLVNILSLHMGIQEPEPLTITVTNAAPHDVYFQVLTLLKKVNRLSYEQTRRRAPPPPVLSKENIEPADVKRMVDTAFTVLRTINQDMGVTDFCPMVAIKKGITPSQVFIESMHVNRHLNSLLERRFSPSEVYQIVNMSIGYASNLLAQYSGAERIPQKPVYEKNKRPLDVYYRLHSCLLSIIKICQENGLDILAVDISGIEEKNISPSDVFDMASLVLARLDLLTKKNNIHRSIREAYYPGRKFPSDVYQQVGILEQQLKTLLSFMEKRNSADR